MNKIVEPMISVVMPVYNNCEYIEESIKSILNQSYKNYEFIIVNDCSDDQSLEIISKYMKCDNRIVLINKLQNKGIVECLNSGIMQSKGKYIARMDADDISLPTRLEEQINFFDRNNVDILGTWITKFSKEKKLSVVKNPIIHQDILFSLFFKSAFSHPSVMMRRSVFDYVNYSNEIAEDYKLWCDLAIKKYKFANIPKILLHYRVHNDQLTLKKKNKNYNSSKNISLYFSKNVDDKMNQVLNKYWNNNIKNRKNFSEFCDIIIDKLNEYNVSRDYSKIIFYHMYNNLKYRNLIFYVIFFIKTRKFKKNILDEIKLIIKSNFLFSLIKKITL